MQPGGAHLERTGLRQAPSIRYARFAPSFRIDAHGKASGGLFWDGRADTLQAQAREPFLNPSEMAMPSKQAVIDRVQAAPYAGLFAQAFGAGVFSNAEIAFDRVAFALAQYQRESTAFAPFTSKYDDFLAGRATLSDAELRGLAAFNDPHRGNCAACHPSARAADGTPPLFTDFSYDVLGVPRNAQIPATADPSYNDLGVCARPSGDLASRPQTCGAFKVPSLRNVAARARLFHNARFTSLKEALTFYVQRDTSPQRWYTSSDGVVRAYDDLPMQYTGNVNRTEVPYNRHAGDAPALNDAEIDDLVAFLNTLTDADVVAAPSTH